MTKTDGISKYQELIKCIKEGSLNEFEYLKSFFNENIEDIILRNAAENNRLDIIKNTYFLSVI